MNTLSRYLTYAVLLLTLVVLDQAWALHRLSEFSEMQSQISDDYFNQLVECTNKQEKK